MHPQAMPVFVVAFGIAALAGGPMIGTLKKVGARQTVSVDAPASHATKQGTPTMGGLIILIGCLLPMGIYVWQQPSQLGAVGIAGLLLAFALTGLTDDLMIARRGKNQGLTAPQKFLLQVICAAGFLLWISKTAIPNRTTVIRIPWSADFDLGSWYYPLACLMIVGMSNAINLTDGLDGLASGVTALIAVMLAVTVYAIGTMEWLPVFAVALAGACCGFLWHNTYPARVFMGDTGSLPLGAALAGIAILGKVEILMLLAAAVPLAEVGSVMIQVTVFKVLKHTKGIEYAREHRVFRRTPLHHHFEESGWHETTIVQRFWLLTVAAAAASAILTGRLP